MRYTGKGTADEEALRDILKAHDVRILDASTPKMMLIDTIKENALPALRSSLPKGWEIFAENKAFKVPDTRRKVIRK